jgi:hypothetical protein
VPTLGYTFYVSNNATGAAAEMNANIRSTVRSVAQIASSTVPSTFLADETSFLEPWFQFDEEHNLTEIPFSGIMTPLIEDYMVQMYSIQGFFHSMSSILGFEITLMKYHYQHFKGIKPTTEMGPMNSTLLRGILH